MRDSGDFRLLVEAHHRRADGLLRLRTLGIAAATAVAVFLLAVLLDPFARLSVGGRALAALVVLGAWVWCGRFVWKWFVQKAPSDDEVVLAIERRIPGGVANRLI